MKMTPLQEYNITELKLSHSFALKMAAMICWSVVSCVMLLGIYSGEITPIRIGITLAIALILAIITFTNTRSACL